jgi:protein-S-isoprenylcysteine O-methyltransferase Ste14
MRLEHKIPPPIVALFFGALMWLIAFDAPGSIGAIRIFCIFICWLIGVYFSVSALRSFRRAKTTPNPLKPELATTLVVSGVFRLTRNPMYVGVAFILLAWAIYLGVPWALLGVLGFVVYINYFQIMPEEKAMLSLFGDEYIQYCSKVRRWL